MAQDFFKVKKGIRHFGLATDPVDAEEGDFYFNSTSKKFRGFDGTTWSDVGTGSTGSSGGGTDQPADGFQAVAADTFDDAPGTGGSTVKDSLTNATHDSARGLFRLACDKSVTINTSGTTFSLSAPPGFTIAAGDIIWSDAEQTWRRIASLTNQQNGTLNQAFTNNLSGDTGMVSQAVWTEDIINLGDPAGSTAALPFASIFGALDNDSIQVEYQDSLALNDVYGDLDQTANIVVAASNSGLLADTGEPNENTFAPYFARPTAPPPDTTEYALLNNATKERMHLVFFPNPDNGSVTTAANLLEYRLSLYAQEVLSNGGFLNAGFGISDNTGLVNISSIATVFDSVLAKNVTEVTLSFDFVPGLNSGSPEGELSVLVDGQQVPREYSGVDGTKTVFWKEVSGSTRKFRLSEDFSTSEVSIEAYRRQGSIDTSSQNALDIADLKVNERNYAQNSEFRFFQRQVPGTLTSRQDDQYGPDRWYVLTSGGAVNVQTARVADSPAASPSRWCCQVRQADSTARQVGLASILSADRVTELRGQTVTFAFWVRTDTTEITTIRAALVNWTGTADSVTSDIVSSWSATPTLVANASYANTPADYTISSSWQQFTVTTTLSGSLNNLVLFVWTPNTEAQNDDFYVTQFQVVRGTAARSWSAISIPYAVDQNECEMFYEKTYQIDAGVATTDGVGAIYYRMSGNISNATFVGFTWRVRKRSGTLNGVIGTFLTYSPTSGASNNVRNSTAGADRSTTSGSAFSEVGYQLNYNGTTLTDQDIILWQYSIDAEL